MVAPGVTVAVPCGSVQALHTPLSIDREVAAPLLTCQVNVACPAAVIVVGDAVKLRVNGTFTVTVPVTVPPGPVAVRVKTVVVLTGTIDEPDVGSGPLSSIWLTGGLIVTDVAFVVAQVIVVVWPPLNAAGFAVNCVIWGRTACAT